MGCLYMTLSSLRVDGEAVITDITAEDGMRRRLYELGFVPDVRTRCIMRSPLGSPSAYEICGAVIALRERDAKKILIRECD